jgi:hypothetical protein
MEKEIEGRDSPIGGNSGKREWAQGLGPECPLPGSLGERDTLSTTTFHNNADSWERDSPP